MNSAVSSTASLTLSNANPSFDTGKPAFASARVNCAANTVTLNFGFSDAGLNDTHTSTINWGDGAAAENLDALATALEERVTYVQQRGPVHGGRKRHDDDNGSTGNTNSTNALVVEYNLS